MKQANTGNALRLYELGLHGTKSPLFVKDKDMP